MQGRAQSLPQVLSLLGAFVATAMVMGVLMAGLLIPGAYATGAATNSSIAAFEELPSEFTTTALAQQSVILDAAGGVIATPYNENRIIVGLDEVAPIMRTAILAIEDSRFYEHNGVDLRGMSRAFVSNMRGNEVQGASTITQQYVKMALQEAARQAGDKEAEKAASADSYQRKIQEAKYAMSLEQELSKDEILEAYLNLSYFGALSYGVEAASLRYFNISASELNLGQAAVLAGLVQNPGTTDPISNPEGAERRRNVVLDRIGALGLAKQDDIDAWKAVPITEMLDVQPQQSTCQNASMPFVCQYVINWLLDNPEFGETREERENLLYTGGLTVKTTFDPAVYRSALLHMTELVPVGDPTEVGAAAVVVEPGTGRVISLGQTSTFGNDQGTFGVTEVNWSVDQKYGESGGFQIGSTAKIYSVVRAVEEGMGLETTVNARRYSGSDGAVFDPSESVDNCAPLEPMTVRNSEGNVGGDMTFRRAIARSVNTAFVPLVLSKVGICDTQETMARMGLHKSNGQPIDPYLSEVTLGSGESSPLTVALSYATLAAGGRYCEALPVTEVLNSSGEAIMTPEPKCEQVVDEEVARGVNDLLRSVMEPGGTGASQPLAGGRESAGKTGTTDGLVQSWFAGYTPQLATAVYVGRPDSNTRSMSDIQIGGQYYRRVYGNTLALPIWKRIMDDALAGKELLTFPRPSPETVKGRTVDIPNVAGRTLAQARKLLADAGFDGNVVEVNNRAARGTVLGSQPSSSAPWGSSVTILVSNGYVPPPPPPRPQPTTTSEEPSDEPSPEPPAPSAEPTNGGGNNGGGRGGPPPGDGRGGGD